MGELVYWGGYIACSLYAWYNGSVHEDAKLTAGPLILVVALHLIYCFVWPVYWPYMIYFYEKEKANKFYKRKSIEQSNQNYTREHIIGGEIDNIKTSNPTDSETGNKEIQNRNQYNKSVEIFIQNSSLKNKKDVSLILQPLEEQFDRIEVSKKLVENLSKNSQPTAYQCLKCFYKWNYDPVLRCAMCSELGPYNPHSELFPRHNQPEK